MSIKPTDSFLSATHGFATKTKREDNETIKKIESVADSVFEKIGNLFQNIGKKISHWFEGIMIRLEYEMSDKGLEASGIYAVQKAAHAAKGLRL